MMRKLNQKVVDALLYLSIDTSLFEIIFGAFHSTTTCICSSAEQKISHDLCTSSSLHYCSFYTSMYGTMFVIHRTSTLHNVPEMKVILSKSVLPLFCKVLWFWLPVLAATCLYELIDHAFFLKNKKLLYIIFRSSSVVHHQF